MASGSASGGSISSCRSLPNVGERRKRFSPSGASFDVVDSNNTSARDVEALPQNSMTLSGATGKHLAQELAEWVQNQRRTSWVNADLKPRNAWERVEIQVKAYYDMPFGWFINGIYDVLQMSSGRDKFCGFLQNYAKFAAAKWAAPGSERLGMYRGIEDSLSDGRKIFRFFKEFREVYKIRRGFHRMQTGILDDGFPSVMATCGCLDVLGHTASFFFYCFDNLLWAASVGIVRAKEVPRWQREMWQGFRRNGFIINSLGGVSAIKRKKNIASIWRLVFAVIANVLLLWRAIRSLTNGAFQGLDDPRLFHSLELLGMAASFRDLLDRLDMAPISSEAYAGQLGMVAAASGLWSNWRKVRKDQCGTKNFLTAAERRAASRS